MHDYIQRAYTEMVHERALIPEDTRYCRSYLENTPLH